MSAQRKIVVQTPSAKSDDQPATRKMLKLVRRELIQKMDSGFNRMEGRFAGIEARFAGVEGKFAGIDEKFAKVDERFARIDERFARIDERFAKVDASLNELKASSSRMEFLLEEQNANNRVVLEGLQVLWQRQARLDAQLNPRPSA